MKQWTLPAVLESIPELTSAVDEQLEALDCAMKAQMQIDVAIDELFANIARYAYPDGAGNATVLLEFDPASRTVSLTFSDEGIPFDPLQQADPDVTLSGRDREVGGLGIFLVKKSMDSMVYRRENGRNILTISKTV